MVVVEDEVVHGGFAGDFAALHHDVEIGEELGL